jgi:primosomal protein N' (replication factor Y) (superfamily II helicase)
MYADVIFPIKLNPLTYRIPDGFGADIKGCIVLAPLMNKNRPGLVVKVRNETDAGLTDSVRDRIKDIVSVHDRFASENHLQFLQWISDYYLAPEGITLKSSFFEEAAAGRPEPGKPRKNKKNGSPCDAVPEESITESSRKIIDDVVKSIRNGTYSALLYHAPDIESEYLSALNIIKEIGHETGGITLLAPEINVIEKIAPALRSMFGERIVALHARLPKKKRQLAIHDIISGKADIVVGTRSAMLAPLPRSRFIAVIEEHSPSYKAEEGSRYNARDLAVMKAYMDKSCVLLMSVCPSVESMYNARKGKYRSMNKLPGPSDVRRPRVKIITHRPGGKNPSSLSSGVISEARAALRNHEQAVFLVGRKGYSLLRCDDCGHIEYCAGCATPMVFYKKTGALKCHHCGNERPAPETCSECGGVSVSIFTAGVDRVREDLETLLNDPAVPAGNTVISAPKTPDDQESGFIPYVIGAGIKRKKSAGGKYSAAILMNIDLLSARPDFRAHERAFQEIIEISQLVKPEGLIIIQTSSRGSKILKLVRDYDFDAFYEMEFSQRREIAYPPFERIILLSVMSKSRDAMPAAALSRIVDGADGNVMALGPVEVPARSKRYACCSQIILKSADHKQLREAARKILTELEKNKKIRVTVDVDPLKI